MRVRLAVAALIFLIFAPVVANAFPFGGRIYVYRVCHNETIFARLSPPVPGDYVWTTATKTYQFGPPRGVGQWLLGLTGIPFDCLWSVNPIFPVPAIAIAMMGSSGSASGQPLPNPSIGSDGNQGSGGYTSDPTQPGGTPTSPGNVTPVVGKMIISEVFYNVDAAHGTDPTHEWVELYNGTGVTVNLSGWSLQDAAGTDVIPTGTQLAPGKFIVIAQSAEVRTRWNIPNTITVIALGSPIGDGLGNVGDVVRLNNASNMTIDAVSWGTNTSAFSPSALVVQSGHALSRSSLLQDLDMASDWRDVAVPSPGS